MQRHVGQYLSVGYTQPVDLFSLSESMTMRRLFFEAIGQTEEQTRHISEEIANWHVKYEWCYQVARNHRLVDLVQSLLDTPDVMVWSMLFWYKQAGDLNYVPWHQDGAYWSMNPVKTITAWIALGDVDHQNGALQFLPGRREELQRHSTLNDSQSEFITQFPDKINDEDAVRIDMMSGQACLFDAFTVHRTGPNHTSKGRIGCAVRYATPEVAFDASKWHRYQPEIFMLRGRDRQGLNPAFMRAHGPSARPR